MRKQVPGKLPLIAKMRGKSLDDMMAELVEKYDGNLSAIARDLDVAPTAVRNWLQKHDYQPPGPRGWSKKTELVPYAE